MLPDASWKALEDFIDKKNDLIFMTFQNFWKKYKISQKLKDSNPRPLDYKHGALSNYTTVTHIY